MISVNGAIEPFLNMFLTFQRKWSSFGEKYHVTSCACQSWGRERRGLRRCVAFSSQRVLIAWRHLSQKPWSPLTIVLRRTCPHGETTGVYFSMFNSTLVAPSRGEYLSKCAASNVSPQLTWLERCNLGPNTSLCIQIQLLNCWTFNLKLPRLYLLKNPCGGPILISNVRQF